MKIKFKDNLEYQQQAIKAVTDVFLGQEICQANFTVSLPDVYESKTQPAENYTNILGIGNQLKLLDEDIHENIRNIQQENNLAESKSFNSEKDLNGEKAFNLTIEMETGTGKTYVYLRTIFELNKQYGFTKFIVVVPSVAIREGVYKTLQITEEHFKSLYNNTSYDYFIYDSSKLTEVRNFATSSNIQIMVINIDAFKKSFDHPEKQDKANIIHRYHDRLSGAKPIEFIQQTNPIVIIDEPQSVDNTSKSKEAITSLNPLCSLRYSATHLEKYHMLYKLDAIDAYQQQLVKQIEVIGIKTENAHNQPYIKLLSVNNKTNRITARIEIDKQTKTGAISRKTVTVRSGTDLTEAKYSNRSIYDGYIIEDIDCTPKNEYISFTSKDDILHLKQAIGDVDPTEKQRLQIKRTIEEHLDKELTLLPQGIKVLSLFFIDKVANYRFYENSKPQQGKFAKIFEEEYKRAIDKPKYKSLSGKFAIASELHDGYFSVDKKKDSSGNHILKDSKLGKHGESGKTNDDATAYNLIMQDKEKLLSLDCKLKFIFSHSALREGWDNPNVFQICTLNETKSVIKKRQEIGRGLRIAVNQQGKQVLGFAVNTLTVMANESYEQFAKQLQQELEQETGIKFGVVAEHEFANIVGADNSQKLFDYLQKQGYITSTGKIENSLKIALKNNTLELPEAFSDHAPQITAQLNKVVGNNLNIKNATDKRKISLNKQVFLSEDFKQLWDKIKYKTKYQVDFDVTELIENCVDKINQQVNIIKPKIFVQKAKTTIDRSGVNSELTSETTYTYEDVYEYLPDIITELQAKTNLTRKTIVHIINASDKLEQFKLNPQKFIEQVLAIINTEKRLLLADGIKYQKIGNDEFYTQELFDNKELFGYFEKNMVEANKSVYDHVLYDSSVELEFANKFEINTAIKLYAKLPSWFKIATPLGNYNPDWAVVTEEGNQGKLYLVVETKSTLLSEGLRPKEQLKFECGEKHFVALNNDVKFEVVTDPNELYS